MEAAEAEKETAAENAAAAMAGARRERANILGHSLPVSDQWCKRQREASLALKQRCPHLSTEAYPGFEGMIQSVPCVLSSVNGNGVKRERLCGLSRRLK